MKGFQARVVLLLILVTIFVLSCEKDHHRVTLTWQAPAPIPGVTVVGYNVYRSDVSGRGYVRIAARISTAKYEDRRVERGRTYFYVVTALDQVGRESRFSGEAKAQIP